MLAIQLARRAECSRPIVLKLRKPLRRNLFDGMMDHSVRASGTFSGHHLMSTLDEPNPPQQGTPVDSDPIRLWLARRGWPISWMRSMSGFIATMTWIALAYELYLLRRFAKWGYEIDRVREGIELSGHFLVALLITWQFVRLRRLRQEQVRLLADSDVDYSGIAKSIHGWLITVAISSILLGAHSLVSSYETYVGFPRWTAARRVDALKSDLRDPEVEKFSLQVREGSYDPQPGWSESSMIVQEPVTKKVYLAEQTLLEAEDIAEISRSWDDSGNPALSFQLNAAAAAKFRVSTEAMTGRSMAFILNGKILTLPKVTSPMGSSFQITGLEQEEVDSILDTFDRYSRSRR